MENGKFRDLRSAIIMSTANNKVLPKAGSYKMFGSEASPKLATYSFQLATYKTTSVSTDTDVVLFLSGSLFEILNPTVVTT